MSRSCGCLQKDELQKRQTHGKTYERAYRIYGLAKGRCQNPNLPGYENYGGRGIRFLYTSFEQFYADMGDPPPWGTIERCNNDGHYEPGNCRWASRKEQNNNRRNHRMLTAFGRTQTASRWAKEFNIRQKTLRSRIDRGWSSERALTAPLKFAGARPGPEWRSDHSQRMRAAWRRRKRREASTKHVAH